ncbi:50S ribosomal protein L28 [Candidatus Uhrbacteria bacterium]|nr:50S ribosomal protein L28 [Candidatus Uhrbacteria bacterium]
MSRIDQLTGKRANFGQSRSHSNRATKRRQNVNLQTIRLAGTKVRVSTRTIKTLKRITAQLEGKLPTLKQKRAQKRATRAAAAKV